jgi:hypothetical protein
MYCLFLGACTPVTYTSYPTSTSASYHTRTPTRIVRVYQTSTPKEITGCANNGNLNIRSEPGGDQVIGFLLGGTCGVITGKSADNYWVFLETDDVEGWVTSNASYLTISGNLSNVSVISNTIGFSSLPTLSYSDTGCPYGCTYHQAGCDIKGNISFDEGEKIYHLPGGEFYDATVINPDYGERWFCTEQEAINNGWRKSEY